MLPLMSAGEKMDRMTTRFVVEGTDSSRAYVYVHVQSISSELALILGRKALEDRFGSVRGVTVRYAASDHRMSAADFTDPNRLDQD